MYIIYVCIYILCTQCYMYIVHACPHCTFCIYIVYKWHTLCTHDIHCVHMTYIVYTLHTLQVKETVSAESYRYFATTMKVYKTNKDFEAMFTCVSTIFGTDVKNYSFYRSMTNLHVGNKHFVCYLNYINTTNLLSFIFLVLWCVLLFTVYSVHAIEW